MTMKKIAFLGCGWLGLPTAQAFLSEGWQVSVSTTSSNKLETFQSLGLKFYLLDIYGELLDAQPFWQSDVLCITVPFKRSLNDPWVYPEAMQKVMQVARTAGITRVILTSSTSVYAADVGLCDEMSPTGSSERSKVLHQVEQYVLNVEGCKATVLRLAGLIGPGREPGRFLRGMTDLPNPNHPVNLVHLADVVQVIRAVVDQEAWGHIFNVVADEHPTRQEFYMHQAQQIGLDPPIFLAGTQTSGKHVSNDLVKEVLGISFYHGLKYNYKI